MKPIEFKEQNVVFAKDQPEYIPLPAHRVENDPRGEVVFCMSLSIRERLRLLFTGRLWCSLLTFNKPLTPSFFSTKKSDLFQNQYNRIKQVVGCSKSTIAYHLGKDQKRKTLERKQKSRMKNKTKNQ